jgi:hypothetical protein
MKRSARLLSFGLLVSLAGAQPPRRSLDGQLSAAPLDIFPLTQGSHCICLDGRRQAGRIDRRPDQPAASSAEGRGWV